MIWSADLQVRSCSLSNHTGERTWRSALRMRRMQCRRFADFPAFPVFPAETVVWALGLAYQMSGLSL